MIRRVFFFVLVGIVVITLAWWIAGISGHVTASFGSLSFEMSAPVAILALLLLAALIIVIWKLCGWLLSLPRRGAAMRSRHLRQRGDDTITRLLVAMAADEKQEAWREARRARRLLGDSPYTLLLLAEAGRMSGRDDEAERAFHTLADRRDSRFLGLRGLLRQAVARENWDEAMKIAKQAEDARPGTTWLRQERAELAIKTDNWPEALELVNDDNQRITYYVAAAQKEPDSNRALAYAKRAWQLDPTFTPAVLAYAQRLRSAGRERRAMAIVKRAWKRAPHPDLATFALANHSEKTARMIAARRLADTNPGDPESKMLLAQSYVDAGSFPDARHYAEALLRDGFQQRRLYLLLAEIEEQTRGDTEEGRLAQREALRQAAVADADPRWQCTTCRTEADDWKPKCPVCQSVGTIKWTVAARHDQQPVIEQLPVPQAQAV